MDDPRRVYLSYTSELRSYPEARSFVAGAAAAVARAGDAVLDMAIWSGSPSPSAAAVRDKVASADVVVLIVGFRYGSPVVDDPGSSYPELELAAATGAGVPVLVFLVSEDAPGPRGLLVDAEHGDRQDAFRERVLDSGLTTASVSSPAQLELLLLQALRDLRPPAPAAPVPDLLVSYVDADEPWALWITSQLDMAGYAVVAQTLDSAFVRNFVAHVDRLLAATDRVLVVLSEAYLRSASALSEFATAFERDDGRLVAVGVGGPAMRPPPPGVEVVDLALVAEPVARERLLACVRGRARQRTAPPFPGAPSPPSTPPSSPPPDEPTGPGVAAPPAPAPSAVIVVSDAETGFAIDLSDALSALRDEGVLSSVGVYVASHEFSGDRVSTRVREADVVLLVVSRDLLATEYGSSREVRLLMNRHDAGQCVVIPVIYRAVSWQRSAFGRLPALPPNGVAVHEWSSVDQALESIVDGVRSAVRERASPVGGDVGGRSTGPRARHELGDVFKPVGVPGTTFVEPDDWAAFRMALRQPGLGIVLEGPSGIGKTTLLRRAVAQDRDRLGEVRVLSARRPQDLDEIAALPEHHAGLVAVDDFHRLPSAVQDRLADHLKRLADDDGEQGKLVVVGIPGTAGHLVAVGSDLATRIRVFRPRGVAPELVEQMVTKGEDALNIEFQSRSEIVRASAGSLLTAQMLCWYLATAAGVEHTTDRLTPVRTNVALARVEVTGMLGHKYRSTVDEFVALDGSESTVCIQLLLLLAQTTDGVLRLDAVAAEHPELAGPVTRAIADGSLAGSPTVREHLYYDPRGRRLIADDPQFVFYARQLARDDLLETAGKRIPVARTDVFVCYSHRDAYWQDRLDVHLAPLEKRGLTTVWSDRDLVPGDVWRNEIAAALARARVAVLLVSADFMASEFVQEVELPELLAAAEDGGCRIVPVLVGPSQFDDTPSLARFHHDQPKGTTLSETPESAERQLAEVARSITAVFGPTGD